jgi:uncharacterized protein (TIGR02284 family)
VEKGAHNPVPVLNRIVEICMNGRRGFEEAARVVRDGHLAAILLDYASQREQFAKQIMYQVSRLGGRPETRGTVAGLAHRRWIDVRSALGGDDWTVLQECERGERRATAAYNKAFVEADLPTEVRDLLHDQLTQIKAAHRHLQDLQNKVCVTC